jgi:hypothetical protein
MTSLRASRVRKQSESSRRALWTLIGLVIAIYLPAIATVVLITRAARPDLFDLTPIAARSDQYFVLAWPELERARLALRTGPISSGAMIRALGYMMDGDPPVRNADRVQAFILVPNVAHSAHPDHWFGDQMIAVRLDTGNAVRFAEQSLVWVWGTLRMLPGNPNGHEPLYVLEPARAELANKADIQKYFK